MNDNKIIQGRVYILGNNIDTDQIIPAEYLNLVPTIPEEYKKLGSYALAGLPDGCAPFINDETGETPYTIIIAGKNFGCGSSREHAPISLGAAGVKAVIATSYARIFFRNSVATGELFPLESEKDLEEEFKMGDEAIIDLNASTIQRVSDGTTFALRPLGAVAPVVEAGGIFAYARKTGMIKTN